MKEQKICPLLCVSTANANPGPGGSHCLGDRCAWYVPARRQNGGYCAVQSMGALPDLVAKVGQI